MNVSMTNQIEWYKLAEPQADLYDSYVINSLLNRDKTNSKCTRLENNNPNFFNGNISIQNSNIFSDDYYIPAQIDHKNLIVASNLIQLWPRVFKQCQLLIDVLFPFIDTRSDVNEDISNDDSGSTCGPGGSNFGTIASTINSPTGLAEAIVHEMAHHKLKALGIGFESADSLILNVSGEKYKSPIRYDILRPMTSVFHAQYSYTYVIALGLEIIKSTKNSVLAKKIASNSISIILPKLSYGLDVIKKNLICDNNGEKFFEGYFYWLSNVFEECYEILSQFNVYPKSFKHPLEENSFHANEYNFQELDNYDSLVPYRIPSLLESRVCNELVIYNLESDESYSLNESAKLVWEMCNGLNTLNNIKLSLAERIGQFDQIVADYLYQDIDNIIRYMCDLKIINLK